VGLSAWLAHETRKRLTSCCCCFGIPTEQMQLQRPPPAVLQRPPSLSFSRRLNAQSVATITQARCTLIAMASAQLQIKHQPRRRSCPRRSIIARDL
jgi:hypothetical protein